jgi:hypothetical protein
MFIELKACKESSQVTKPLMIQPNLIAHVAINVFHDAISWRLHHPLAALLLRLAQRNLPLGLRHGSGVDFRFASVFAGRYCLRMQLGKEKKLCKRTNMLIINCFIISRIAIIVRSYRNRVSKLFNC